MAKIGIDHSQIVRAAEEYLGRPVRRDKSDNALVNQSRRPPPPLGVVSEVRLSLVGGVGSGADNQQQQQEQQQQQQQQIAAMDSEQAESLFDTLAR